MPSSAQDDHTHDVKHDAAYDTKQDADQDAEPADDGGVVSADAANARSAPCNECGALLHYAPGARLLRCQYCGHETPIDANDQPVVERDFYQEVSDLKRNAEKSAPSSAACGNCGAVVNIPQHITAMDCPYCDATMVPERIHDGYVNPNAIAPFLVDRQHARDQFQSWVSRRWFAPRALKLAARLEGRLHGVYTPYWTYDSHASSYYRGSRGENYYVTKHYTVRVNGKTQHRTRRVQKTRWYPAAGTVYNDFNDILILASRSLPRSLANKLEPWKLALLEPYHERFFAGFHAERYQVDLEDGFKAAETVMETAIHASVNRDIGGDKQRIYSIQTTYNGITFKHLLLPIWVSSYVYRNQTYQFVINGQTGEVQGQRPYSFWKIALLVGAIIAIAATVLFMVSEHMA